MSYIEKSSRIFETIIGVIGGILGLIGCSFILLIGSFGLLFGIVDPQTAIMLGILGLIGSCLGIFAGFYVNVDNYLAGFMFFIGAILLIIGATVFGIPGMLLLFIAGILSLIRTNS